MPVHNPNLSIKYINQRLLHLRCTTMFTNSVFTLFFGLTREMHKIRPHGRLVFGKDSAHCIEITTTPEGRDKVVIHFIIAMNFGFVEIHCDNREHRDRQHWYTTVIKPLSGPDSAKFIGCLKYTNKWTGYVVETAYTIDRPWHLHGIPRNIENKRENAMTLKDIAALCQ